MSAEDAVVAVLALDHPGPPGSTWAAVRTDPEQAQRKRGNEWSLIGAGTETLIHTEQQLTAAIAAPAFVRPVLVSERLPLDPRLRGKVVRHRDANRQMHLLAGDEFGRSA